MSCGGKQSQVVRASGSHKRAALGTLKLQSVGPQLYSALSLPFCCSHRNDSHQRDSKVSITVYVLLASFAHTGLSSEQRLS